MSDPPALGAAAPTTSDVPEPEPSTMSAATYPSLATDGNVNAGINGVSGLLGDMAELGVWDTFQVKVQTIKTAVESACMLLRIDDIVSGIGAKQQ